MARTALRQGAEVTLLYRRTRKEMPAEAYEVNAAMEEGVNFRFLVNPAEMLGKNGKPEKLVIENMKLGEPDESGRCRPLATGKTYTEAFDTVIAAISQKTDVSCLGNDDEIDRERLRLTKHKTAESDADTMHWQGKIFAGGDFRRGPATAIEAVADGKTAAISIDRFLRGEIMRTIPAFNSEKAEKTLDIDPAEFDHIKKQERLQADEAEPQKRRRSNEEVEKVFPLDKASEEAARRVECGCMANNNCLLRDHATEYAADQKHFAGEHAQHPVDDSHPFIQRDPNKCINCGRCIRICAEVQGPAVLGYIYRGFSTIVGPEFGGKLEDTPCTTCGKCIEVCPTGALLPKTRSYKLNPDYYQTRSTRCTECEAACFVDIRYAGDTVLQVDPQKDNDHNGGDLCYKGKFAWQNEDLQYSAERIGDLTGIPKDTVLLISPKMTDTMITEAVAYAKEHELTYLTTEYVPDPGDGQKGHASMKDLMDANIIILFDPLNQMLKARARLAQLNGSKLFIVSETQDHYHRFADKIFSSVADLEASLPSGKMFLSYNREDCPSEIRKKVWDIAGRSPSARIWVNSDYLNTRGMPEFHIPAVPLLQTESIIVFGPTPDNVKAERIFRLPLKAFSLQGNVISDSGEKIEL
ncbi:MAG: 4Fe-4S binding protein [Candidatus Marinimicrobia bacterium]|nr:4Fe-4S binding protein [Candidatus Neomarinimicrobiota bacterium]